MTGILPLTRRGLMIALLAGCAGLPPGRAAAQLAPSQPIRIIVGVPAGGLGDLAARIIAQRLSETGHPAIVENRLGGNGIIATDAVAKARADGYTLIMGNHTTLAILPHLIKVGYDPAKDLQPVTLMLAVPNVVVTRAALPVTSMTELIAYGKANRLTNATQGIGASGHLIGEQFKQLTGVELTHVHYRGAALALQDVVAGHVDMMFDVVALTREHAAAGRVRALAVLAAQRNPVLPEVPTSAEVGLAVEAERIPVLTEGAALCREFALDPLGTIASGALLLALAPTDAGILLHALAREGIDAAFIGRVVPREAGVVLTRAGQPGPMPRFDQDEITRLFA